MSRTLQLPASARPASAGVVARALRGVASALQLSQAEVAEVLGSSTASVSRAFAGQRGVDPASAEGRHALLLIRLFRSLDALLGGDAGKAGLWLRAQNRHLGGPPLRLIATTQGLVHVADYLDALRGTL